MKKNITITEFEKALTKVLNKAVERDEKRLKEGYFDSLKKK